MRRLIAFFLVIVWVTSNSAFAEVNVAVVRSWDPGGGSSLPVITELNNNWSAYGSTPLTINTSLLNSDFTYQDLKNTGADVLWICDPAGIFLHYSPTEIAAIQQYVNEGHSILGTYLVFQSSSTDNRALASIFGLRQDILYSGHNPANQSFDVLVNHPLFNNILSPYVSGGYPYAQVPSNDLTWDAGDLGAAQLLAQTADKRGVITWYQTPSYRAIYISEMPEYYGNQADTQFLYNALTVPEPATLLLLGLGTIMLRKR